MIKPSALGDVIHALPVLVKLRARYPGAEIDWLITPQNAGLLSHHPARPNLVFFHRHVARGWRGWWAGVKGFCTLLRTIRQRRYDLVIDLHGQLRSAVFCLAAGAPVRLGFGPPLRSTAAEVVPARGWKGAREFSWLAYTHHLQVRTLRTHAVERYLWLAPMLALDGAPPDFRVYLDASARSHAQSLLACSGSRPLAVLAPGTTWETKHWTPEGFAFVARCLMESGFHVVLAGAPRDHQRCAAVASMAAGALNLCGTTSVVQLAAILERASLCVSNDSGPMHLAVAMNCPVVSIFGPTDALRIGPYGLPGAVVRAGVACSPCHLRQLRHCPHHHACMLAVSPEAVLARIRLILRASLSVAAAG